MSPNAPHTVARRPGWRLPALSRSHAAIIAASLLVAVYVAGWMVGQEQERDLQLARQQACAADPHCLRP